jgi:5-methylcytosine-specific restriction enzyme subunit McrC
LNILELIEEVPKQLEENQSNVSILSNSHRKYEDKITIDHNPFTHIFTVTSNGYVGYLPIDEQSSVYIRPKVEVQNIFRLLEYTYKLASFELFQGIAPVSSIEDVFERLAMILAKRVLDRNKKGLYRGYIQRTQPLHHIRGRILVEPSLVSMFKGSTQPICQYEENTADLVENEIILWTLHQLHCFEIKRPEVKKTVRMAYRELVNKVSLEQFRAKDCINRFYNRLNLDYKPIHGICRFFLEHSGPGLNLGSHNLLPFVVHMPSLFESFAAEWLKEKLPRNFRLEPQFQASLDTRETLVFRIDLVIKSRETNAVVCVLDTKYKKDPASKAKDVKDIIAYAAKMQTSNAFLIYPSGDIESFDYQVGTIKVRSLILDISRNVQYSGVTFVDDLLSCLNRAR